MSKIRFNNVLLTKSVGTTSLYNPPVGEPVILGNPTEDETVTVDASGISDADGLGSFSYQWYADNVAISGATTTSLLLGDTLVGKSITVTVSYTDGDGNPESVTSSAVGPVANINDNPSGAPLIQGTVDVGETVTADTSSITDDDGLGSFSYQWKRNGVNISGATSSSYTIQSADTGTLLSVTVTYTDGQGTVEYVSSAGANVSYAVERTFLPPDIYGLGQYFGNETILTTDYAIISEPFAPTPIRSNGGIVYVYDRTTGNMVRTFENPYNSSGFGSYDALAATNDYVFCTVNPSYTIEQYDINTGNLLHTYPGGYMVANDSWFVLANSSGVSLYDPSTGNLIYTLNVTVNPNELALDGDILALAEKNYDSPVGNAGRTIIMNVATNTVIREVQHPSPIGNDYFGFRVALKGNYVANSQPSSNTGNMRTYIHRIDTGELVHTIVGYDTYWGREKLYMDLNYLYIANYLNSNTKPSGLAYGAVQVYDIATGTLVKTISNPNIYGSGGDNFGVRFSVDGSYMLVGAPYEENSSGTRNYCGAAYLINMNT